MMRLHTYGVTAGLVMASFALGTYVARAPEAEAQGRKRLLEIRTYTTAEGKLDSLVERMGKEEMQLLAKHGMKNELFSVAVDPPLSANTFVWAVSHESRDAAKKSWEAALGDPEFKAMLSKWGRTTIKSESIFLSPTDYSPLK
jgi:hypothetical protein